MAAAEKIAAGAPEPSTRYVCVLFNAISNHCYSVHIAVSTERSRNEPVGEKWWLYRPKNRIIQGSLLDDAFQVSLKYRNGQEDPISMPLCSEWIPYHSVPHWYELFS